MIMMPPLPEVLDNGFTPLQAYLQDDGENYARLGVYRYSGVVLAQRVDEDNPNQDRWATWTLHFEPMTGNWETTSGDYFSEIDRARYLFGRKVAAHCWGATMRGMTKS